MEEKFDRPSEQHKVFIGGISWNTTKDELRKHFAEFGQVKDVILMVKKRSRQPRGFGFVVFASDKGVEAAVKSRRHTIHGRAVEVKRAIPKQEMDRNNKMDPQKIFAGGLPPAVDNQALASYFETFGKVTDAIVMMDRQTKRSRGFGFVTFQDSTAAAKALSQAHRIDGKEIEVKRAEPKNEKQDATQPPVYLPQPPMPMIRAFGYHGGIPVSGYGATAYGVPAAGPYSFFQLSGWGGMMPVFSPPPAAPLYPSMMGTWAPTPPSPSSHASSGEEER